MNDIAKSIRKIRNARKISQETLAQELHVTRQAISNWETGKAQPDLTTPENICAFFDIELIELLYGPKPQNAFCVNKPRRIRNTIILSVITVMLFSIQWALFIYGRKFMQRYYNPSWLCVGVFFQYLFFLSGTFTVLSLVYIWHNIALKRRILRIVLLIAGIILAAIPPIAIISANFAFPFIYAVTSIFSYLMIYKCLPLLYIAAGVCLFFGVLHTK